jgi:hypothetical protein
VAVPCKLERQLAVAAADLEQSRGRRREPFPEEPVKFGQPLALERRPVS